MATAPQSFPPLPKISRPVADWVESIRELTQPAAIHWCEGSDAEYASLIGELTDKGELQKLNPRPSRTATSRVPIRRTSHASST